MSGGTTVKLGGASEAFWGISLVEGGSVGLVVNTENGLMTLGEFSETSGLEGSGMSDVLFIGDPFLRARFCEGLWSSSERKKNRLR